MTIPIIDTKLKNLIQVCRETGNNKKLAVVGFILTSNTVNEIGIYLGVRPRNKVSGETIFEYMGLINEIFQMNLKIPIFQNTLIEKIRECEILFLRNKGDIPYSYIKSMFHIYYELRKVEVPNLYKSLEGEDLLESSKIGMFSFLTKSTKRKEKDNQSLKPLILQKINEKESALRKNLQGNFNSQQFETAIHLKSVKNSILHNKSGKISVQGSLKDNIRYQCSIDHIFRYFILGVILLLASIGMLILIELSSVPVLSGELSWWTLIFVGASAILIYFYLKQIRKERL